MMLVLEKSKTKRIFTTRGKKLILPELQNTKTLIKDFSKIQNKIDFYDQLRQEYIFEIKPNSIEIITDFLFNTFLKAGAKINKSLEIIQNQSILKFKTLIETLIEKVQIDIEDFKRFIKNWSDEKYQLNIEKEKISVTTTDKKILTLKKDNFTKKHTRLDYEIAFFFRRNLFRLLSKTISLITQDYSHLYSF